jgi:hypothetical protein
MTKPPIPPTPAESNSPADRELSILSSHSASLEAPSIPLEDVGEVDDGALPALIGWSEAPLVRQLEREWQREEGRSRGFLAEFKDAPRHPLDSMDPFPSRPGIFAVYYEPSSPRVDPEEPDRRPRFLELLAAEDLPLFVGIADEGATIRNRVNDVAELIDEAKGLSWTWFQAAALPVEDDYTLRTFGFWLNDHLTFSPWFWMGFDRLLSHQHTEVSACALVTHGTGYPSDDVRSEEEGRV